jgi:mannose-6-phosphate isomerase
MSKDKIQKIKGKIQHYAWGGNTFIPTLLRENSTHIPCAEYWLGIHPAAVSTLQDGTTLLDWINSNAPEILGSTVFNTFQELPFLLKVLDVKEMLSIQVHPTKTAAIQGFEEEDKKGIPLNAPNRNFKDKNHKPEIMIALSPFWLLHGFKNSKAVEETLTQHESLKILLPLFKKEGYKGLYQYVMEIPQQQVDNLLIPVLKSAIISKETGTINKSMPEWWATKMYATKESLQNIDRGIFSIYLFNIVELQKGEAIFQAAGIPHAYLEGQNVELMANSDNVLRGGLTPKHIDVKELLKHVYFNEVKPSILQPYKVRNEKIFNCPVPDFALSEINLIHGEEYYAEDKSLAIVLVIEGAVIVKNKENMVVKSGEALAIAANTAYTLVATGHTVIYKAFTPVNS